MRVTGGVESNFGIERGFERERDVIRRFEVDW